MTELTGIREQARSFNACLQWMPQRPSPPVFISVDDQVWVGSQSAMGNCREEVTGVQGRRPGRMAADPGGCLGTTVYSWGGVELDPNSYESQRQRRQNRGSGLSTGVQSQPE